jgi:hypothetical protein
MTASLNFGSYAAEDTSFPSNIETGDISRIYTCNLEMEQQLFQFT